MVKVRVGAIRGVWLALVGVLVAAVLPPVGLAAGVRERPAAAEPVSLADEVVGLRSASSRTYAQPDGGMLTRVSSVAVNVRDAGGAWKAIDTTLHADASGTVVNARAAVDLSLPADLGAGSVRVTDGPRWVSFALAGAASAARVAGSKATYADAVGSTDATYESLPDGLKETLTIADAQGASTYRFALDVSAGLSPKLLEDGSIAIGDSGGRTRFVIPTPTVAQAGQDEPDSRHVSYRLSADGRELSIVVDRDWLAGAAFPVRVDPIIYPAAALACTLRDGANANSSSCASSLGVGRDAAGVRRGALRYTDFSAVPVNASILYANVGLHFTGQSAAGLSTGVCPMKCVVVVIDQRLAALAVETGAPEGRASWPPARAVEKETYHHEHHAVQAAPRAGRR